MSPHEPDGAAFQQLRDAENMIQAAVDMLSTHLQNGLPRRDIQPLREVLRRALDDIQEARVSLRQTIIRKSATAPTDDAEGAA